MSNSFGRPAEKSSRPYLNTRQTAHYLALSVRTLEQMRAKAEGPRYRRHGRLVFYHVDDLEVWSCGTAGRDGDHG